MSSNDRPTFLFLTWGLVFRGGMTQGFDEKRLTQDGREKMEKIMRDFPGTPFVIDGSSDIRYRQMPYGVRITAEPAHQSDRWLRPERPWEDYFGEMTVIKHEGKYKCWYLTRIPNKLPDYVQGHGRVLLVGQYEAMCYAESEDGMNWTRPNVGICEFAGSADNNILSFDMGGAGAVFVDEQAPPKQRYKKPFPDKLPEGHKTGPGPGSMGLYTYVSPDGLSWKRLDKPLIPGFYDTQNVITWDPGLRQYVAYLRCHCDSRAISRSATSDFTNWPVPEMIMYSGPQERPCDDYYTNCFSWYPEKVAIKPDGTEPRLMFPAVYPHDTDHPHIRMAVSYDGKVFSWVGSHDPIARPGPEDSWDHGGIYAHPNLVSMPDGGLALPYSAKSVLHERTHMIQWYDDYPTQSGYAWAQWPEGRLAGIEAAEQGEFWTNPGQFWERPTTFQGKHIEINARTIGAGTIEAELWEDNACLEGFAFDQAVPFRGDQVWTKLRWNSKDDLAALNDRLITIRFRLRRAKIFGFRFV